MGSGKNNLRFENGKDPPKRRKSSRLPENRYKSHLGLSENKGYLILGSL